MKRKIKYRIMRKSELIYTEGELKVLPTYLVQKHIFGIWFTCNPCGGYFSSCRGSYASLEDAQKEIARIRREDDFDSQKHVWECVHQVFEYDSL